MLTLALPSPLVSALILPLPRLVLARLPDAAITTDIIVGFPGETEEQFENTLRLMEDVQFDQLNTAAYSPRPHTPAALWDNQVGDPTRTPTPTLTPTPTPTANPSPTPNP